MPAAEGRVEGTTRIFPPPTDPGHRGPKAREPDAPFYNPAMGLNRDLSVLLVQAYLDGRGRGIDVADVLSGTGARALRLAHEVEGDLTVHANDADPDGVAALRKGAAANGVEDRITVTEGGAYAFLASRRFDIVDVDPYGSPAPFLDAAVRAVRHDGLVCLTATDTGALCGTHPKACRRRYAAEPLHRPAWRAEAGLRILQGAVVRAAGRHEQAATPVFAVAQGHWMRVVMRLRDGRRAADRAVASLGHVQEEPRCGGGTWTDRGAGPLWTGPLHDPAVVKAMQTAATGRTLADPGTARLLETLRDEADAPPFWVPLPTAAGRNDLDVPRRGVVMDALQKAGWQACRTHMDPQGVRTDADPDTLLSAMRIQTRS